MKTCSINAAAGPRPSGGYSQAVEVTGYSRLLFISGQIPVDASDQAPADFESQARQVWKNIVLQLEAAGLTLDNLVKVTTFLGDRRHRDANGAIRREVLGDRAPALTVVVTGLYDPSWLLEIEAIAAE